MASSDIHKPNWFWAVVQSNPVLEAKDKSWSFKEKHQVELWDFTKKNSFEPLLSGYYWPLVAQWSSQLERSSGPYFARRVVEAFSGEQLT